MGGVTAVVGKGDLLRKINFPKYVIILSVVLSGLIKSFAYFCSYSYLYGPGPCFGIVASSAINTTALRAYI